MKNFVELKKVNYKYEKTGFEISDVSLKLNKGECAILRGSNGSGKTTLGKLIMGIIKPDSGSVYVGGQDIRKNKLYENAKNISYLFQNPDRHFFCTTAKEEIEFSLLHNGNSEDEADKKATELLERFNMADKADSFPLKLSGGEKQRLALLTVFAVNPSYYILDEPSSGIDADIKNSLIDMLIQIKQTGSGLLIITHDKTMTNQLADRVITMSGGKAAGDETT